MLVQLHTRPLRSWRVSFWITTPLGTSVDVGETVVSARTLRGALRAARALRRVPAWNFAVAEVRP